MYPVGCRREEGGWVSDRAGVSAERRGRGLTLFGIDSHDDDDFVPSDPDQLLDGPYPSSG